VAKEIDLVILTNDCISPRRSEHIGQHSISGGDGVAIQTKSEDLKRGEESAENSRE
jgi:hypothetical protein